MYAKFNPDLYEATCPDGLCFYSSTYQLWKFLSLEAVRDETLSNVDFWKSLSPKMDNELNFSQFMSFLDRLNEFAKSFNDENNYIEVDDFTETVNLVKKDLRQNFQSGSCKAMYNRILWGRGQWINRFPTEYGFSIFVKDGNNALQNNEDWAVLTSTVYDKTCREGLLNLTYSTMEKVLDHKRWIVLKDKHFFPMVKDHTHPGAEEILSYCVKSISSKICKRYVEIVQPAFKNNPQQISRDDIQDVMVCRIPLKEVESMKSQIKVLQCKVAELEEKLLAVDNSDA